jgi:acid stress-induced BolA-like protein IbaG/YrbA
MPSWSANEVCDAARRAIEAALPGAVVEVSPNSPGHYQIAVKSKAFEGKSRVQQQQLVYGAITDLMHGDTPPIHAVDSLKTSVA